MAIFRVLLVFIALVAAPAVPVVAQTGSGGGVVLSYGLDLGRDGSDQWRHSVATIELRPDQSWFGAVKPIWSLGISGDGAVYVAGGIRGDFDVGGFLVTPHFSLALYQDGRGGFDADELVQFRTGIDAFVPISDSTMLGLGYYHLSNARLTSKSADQDVVRLTVLFRF
jgi:hypothetical protein